MDGIRLEQVDASSSVCLDGIVGIRSVGACDVISRVPRVLVGRARLAEKQHKRADDQHGDHHHLERAAGALVIGKTTLVNSILRILAEASTCSNLMPSTVLR